MNADAIIARVRAAAEEGLIAAAEVVKQEAIQRAPLETGELRNSASTSHEGLRAVVAFDSPHAVIQHEELGYHHEIGEAKYLENAVIATRTQAAAVIAAAIRGVVSR